MSKRILTALALVSAVACNRGERKAVGSADTSLQTLAQTDTTQVSDQGALATTDTAAVAAKPIAPEPERAPQAAPQPAPKPKSTPQPTPAPKSTPEAVPKQDMAPLPPGAPSPEAVTAATAKLGMVVYPAKGQTNDVQVRDEQVCYVWAKDKTGIDPTALAVNTDSAAQAGKSAADSAAGKAGVRGAARGAAGGAVVGAIAGDAGKGAAIGAVVGGAQGRKKKKEAGKAAEQQAVASAGTAANQQADTFKKAMSACLDGKGYTVQ